MLAKYLRLPIPLNLVTIAIRILAQSLNYLTLYCSLFSTVLLLPPFNLYLYEYTKL
jgi:hypothetical protein